MRELEVTVKQLTLDNEDLVCNIKRLQSELRVHIKDFHELQMENERLHSQNEQLKRDNEKLKKYVASRQKSITVNIPKRLRKRILDWSVNYK